MSGSSGQEFSKLLAKLEQIYGFLSFLIKQLSLKTGISLVLHCSGIQLPKLFVWNDMEVARF